MTIFINVGRQGEMEDRISKDFKFSEFTKSDTATRLHINNAITSWEVRDNIKALVEDVLQPLRDAWGEPLFINSGYRCLELNKAVGGVPTSQHCLGEGADVGCTDPVALARLAKKMKLDYDQMGVYASFVHFSYKKEGGNRNQIFYAKNYKGPKNI
jgi:uncharacterized protein YcbK (DUF882 family)